MEARILVIGTDGMDPISCMLKEMEGYDVQQVDEYDDMIDVIAIDIIVASEAIDSSMLRQKTDAPLIVVGGGESLSVVKVLLEGADDYVSRPVQLSELRARIEAKLRRAAHT